MSANVIIQMVEKIPATFWGIVVGSFVTLFGVYLTNRSSERRLRIQFENDRVLRIRDREMSFRKDIYLAVTEAVTVGINTLPRFADLSISDNQLATTYLEKVPAIAKAQLVAKEKTAKALTDLATELDCAFLHLSIERLPLIVLHKRIERKEADIRRYAQVRDGMIELMRHHNIEGIRDARRFEVIQDNFKFESERLASAAVEESQMREQLLSRQVALVRACHNESMRINDLVPAALIAARGELELSIDEGAYAEILRHSRQRADAQVEDYLRHLTPPSEETGNDHPPVSSAS